MSTISKYQPSSEKELHGIIEREIESLEEGLKILKYEINIGTGIPDFLCVDSGGRLVIIEVKLEEDKYILYQALRYYSTIFSERYQIASLYKKEKIEPDAEPRIILIAERFSDEIKMLSTFVIPDIELYEYACVKCDENKIGIIYRPLPLPKIESSIQTPTTFEDHITYLHKKELIPIVEKIRDEVKGISNEIEEYSNDTYIGYKHKGRQIAWVETHRNSVDFGVHILDDNKRILDYDYIRIEKPDEDYSEIVDKIKESFDKLKNNS